MKKKEESFLQNNDLWEMVFLIIYGMILLRDTFATTMFERPLPQIGSWAMLLALMIYTGCKMLWHNTYTKKEWWLSAFFLCTCMVAGVISGYHELLYIGFFIVAAKDISFKKILKVYALITIIMLVSAFVASQLGFIENLVYASSRRDAVRNSFGSIYPTDFSAHIFYLICALICLRSQVVDLKKIALPIFGAIFVFVACEGMTSCVTLAFLAACEALYWMVEKNSKLKSVLLNIGAVFYLLPCLVFIIWANLYQAGIPLWDKLNSLLSLRLEFSSKAIHDYGYSVWGQYIEEFGLGGKTEGYVTNFFIDDSYLRILLEYGAVMFVSFMVIFFFTNRKLVKKEANLLLIVCVAIAVHSFMEQHMIEIAYTPFVLLLFADVDCYKSEIKGENNV